MSSSIWTQCAGVSEIGPLAMDAWRVVEAQHQVSTRKLVDSDAEQLLLEQMIESAKPPEPTGGRLHYLLFTPFRYPPLQHGSRFGRRTQPSLWYGAESLSAAFAEVAYYRLVFLEGSTAQLGTVETELTAFQVDISTERGIDLTAPPFTDHRAVIASPTDYSATQQLGDDMRAANIEAFRYPSARDPAGGRNVGAFTPAAFSSRTPRALETWHCAAHRERVELVRRDYFKHVNHTFARATFLIDGQLPAPALQ